MVDERTYSANEVKGIAEGYLALMMRKNLLDKTEDKGRRAELLMDLDLAIGYCKMVIPTKMQETLEINLNELEEMVKTELIKTPLSE